MHVERGPNVVAQLMLEVGQTLAEVADMVVVNDRKRPHCRYA